MFTEFTNKGTRNNTKKVFSINNSGTATFSSGLISDVRERMDFNADDRISVVVLHDGERFGFKFYRKDNAPNHAFIIGKKVPSFSAYSLQKEYGIENVKMEVEFDEDNEIFVTM